MADALYHENGAMPLDSPAVEHLSRNATEIRERMDWLRSTAAVGQRGSRSILRLTQSYSKLRLLCCIRSLHNVFRNTY